MDKEKLKRIGKYMSLLLRHKPEKENLEMDHAGWVKVLELLGALHLTKEELNWIVENNNKKRFEFSDDLEYIRATQGHSFEIDYGYRGIKPPDVLYHGTSATNLNSILTDGLKKMNRQHVHLTENIETAKQVGLRYSKTEENLWLIAIDAKKMHEDGQVFYVTSNSVYLTDNVSSEYFIHDYF